MAYIDVDLLKESVLGWNPPLDTEQLKHMIDTIPCVEVRHGHWKDVQYTYFGLKRYICSECSDDEYWEKRYIEHKESFCPNCGAKMDVPDTNVGEKEGAV